MTNSIAMRNGRLVLRQPCTAVTARPFLLLGAALLLLLLVYPQPLQASAARPDGRLDQGGSDGAVSSFVPFLNNDGMLPRGGVRGLQQVAVVPEAASYNDIGVRAPVIAVALAQQPGTRKFLFIHKAQNNTHKLTVGTLDLDTNQTTLINSVYEHWCSGLTVLGDGRPILVGGWKNTSVLADGRNITSVYDSATNTFSKFATMRLQRWYPTPARLANGSMLIVGGTKELDLGPALPYAELLDPANPAAGTVVVNLPVRFTRSAGYIWFPFINQLPRGEVLWWNNRVGSITDTNWNLVRDLPPLPSTHTWYSAYPLTASITLHALQPDASGAYNNFTLQVFGGPPLGASATTPAGNVSARLDFWYCGADLKTICDGGWIIESMGARRVMGDTTVLPNGKILFHGGAQAGRAGLRTANANYKATRPAPNALMYDPAAPLGSRFSLTSNIVYARMYHSAVCLDLSGKVLVAGCETCGARIIPKGIGLSPPPASDGDNDWRLQLGTPTEIGPDTVRPVISKCPSVITRGSNVKVSYSYSGGRSITGASIVAPCAVTHSINMGQRVIFLPVVSNNGTSVNLAAPPRNQPAVAPFGYYMLFLLGEYTATGRTYSQGCWIRLAEAA